MRWLVLDAGAIDDVDYSAGIASAGLLDFLDSRAITFALARADDSLVETLRPTSCSTGSARTTSTTTSPTQSTRSGGLPRHLARSGTTG